MDTISRCPVCGSNEFITPLNSYDIYQFIDGELSFIRSELTNEPFKLFCRECGKEIEESKLNSV